MEKLSELVDGELDSRSAQHELSRLKADSRLREQWQQYHLIGDVLRGELVLSHGFGRRFSARLASEPTVLAPQRQGLRKVTTYAFSVAASLSAVALVGWVAISTQTATTPVTEVATNSAPLRVEATPVPKAPVASVPYDGSQNEYLLAHTGFSPSTAIQGVAPYIRSVAISQTAAGR